MPDTIITRIGFCSLCFKEHRPHIEDLFLTFGSNGYHLRYATRNGLWGFCPHIYKLIKVIGENVVVERACAMYGCDVDREWKLDPSGDYWLYGVLTHAWKRQIYTLAQWNALVLWKNELQYRI